MQLPPVGYDLRERLGRGGMGEVFLARDQRIGREVAIKRMHGKASPKAIARFLREARIQARLDHPAVVPVHELGIDDDGRPFFTMKRLSGKTLAETLVDEGVATQRLLRAFVEVCLAIELAHARGVVHRDLKPANIMLGDYGEVYVLDWGIARLVADAEREAGETTSVDDPAAVATSVDDPTAAGSSLTRAGAVLGTPGYIPPEQVRGEPIGPAADVYALGAILYEILTRDPLHPPGQEALVSTLSGVPQRPAERRSDRAIAPELDDLCMAALADEPDDRPTVRELADRLQRYLDGDRDLERRRAIAAEQLAAARTAFARHDRATALRHAGRALALDPDAPEAAGLVTQMLVERPAELPAELVEELDQLDRDALRTRSRRAAMSYGLVFGFLAWIPFVEVASWPWLLAFYGVLAFMTAFAWHGTREGKVSPYVSMLGNCALALVWTRIASPFVLAPVMICGALIAVASHPWNQHRKWTIFAWAAITVVLPFALEASGVLGETWRIGGDALHVGSALYVLDGAAATALLFTANLLFVLLVGAFALVITQRARNAQRDLHIHSWHLRHLVPTLPQKNGSG
jgi:eukaryotic-like serine/threonine-protein kinase